MHQCTHSYVQSRPYTSPLLNAKSIQLWLTFFVITMQVIRATYDNDCVTNNGINKSFFFFISVVLCLSWPRKHRASVGRYYSYKANLLPVYITSHIRIFLFHLLLTYIKGSILCSVIISCSKIGFFFKFFRRKYGNFLLHCSVTECSYISALGTSA